MTNPPGTRTGGERTDTTLPSRDEMIRVEAYLRYERNGCVPGRELEDWIEAEREVDRMLALLIPVASDTDADAHAATPPTPARRRRARGAAAPVAATEAPAQAQPASTPPAGTQPAAIRRAEASAAAQR